MITLPIDLRCCCVTEVLPGGQWLGSEAVVQVSISLDNIQVPERSITERASHDATKTSQMLEGYFNS